VVISVFLLLWKMHHVRPAVLFGLFPDASLDFHLGNNFSRMLVLRFREKLSDDRDAAVHEWKNRQRQTKKRAPDHGALSSEIPRTAG
jgi:hypothetical protein